MNLIALSIEGLFTPPLRVTPGNAIIEVETEVHLQRLQNEAIESWPIHMHFECFKGDQAHADLKLVGDAARDHVDRLPKSSRAIKNQRKPLLEQFLAKPLELFQVERQGGSPVEGEAALGFR